MATSNSKLAVWGGVLADVDQTILAALDEVTRREKMLEDFVHRNRTPEPPSPTWPQVLEESIDRKQRLRQLADKANEKVAEVEEGLKSGEAELQQWLESTKAAREKLASWLQTPMLNVEKGN